MKQRQAIYIDSESNTAAFNCGTLELIILALQAVLVSAKDLYDKLANKTKFTQWL